jgi:hypothetical protein
VLIAADRGDRRVWADHRVRLEAVLVRLAEHAGQRLTIGAP